MKLIRGVESQSGFPSEDISDEAAAMLELYLLNREYVDSFHRSAEMISFLYRLGHETLNLAANQKLGGSERFAAFSHGIGTFEAISSLVRPQLGDLHTDREESVQRIMVVQGGLSGDFIGTVTDAKDKLRQDLPRTTQLIGESAARFYCNHADYALSGAALAREVEVGTLAN